MNKYGVEHRKRNIDRELKREREYYRKNKDRINKYHRGWKLRKKIFNMFKKRDK